MLFTVWSNQRPTVPKKPGRSCVCAAGASVFGASRGTGLTFDASWAIANADKNTSAQANKLPSAASAAPGILRKLQDLPLFMAGQPTPSDQWQSLSNGICAGTPYP
jgi:hypothetical protein